MDVFATCLRLAAVLCVMQWALNQRKIPSVSSKEAEPVLEGYSLQKRKNIAKKTQLFFHKP